MASKLCFLLFLFILLSEGATLEDTTTIIYNGFKSANLTLDGLAAITPNGLLMLTNETKQEKAHAFYPNPIPFKHSANDTVLSFSTTFVFAIISQYTTLSGHGLAFIITPTRGLPYSLQSQYLGLFNKTNNGNNTTNHVVAVELDTIQNSEFQDINDNHLGIDINSLQSTVSNPASYFINTSSYVNVSLYSGKPMQVWIEYDGSKKQMNVTLSPINMEKPSIPLLSSAIDLSSILNETMYIGFSSATGSVLTSHYILGWSFALKETAPSLDISSLPKLPKTKNMHVSKILMISLPIIIAFITLGAYFGVSYIVQRKKKFAEEMEDWESQYGPQRFKYKDLYVATKGFRDKELLGSGGFGRVYRGILTKSKLEVAVKKVSHESRQGMREFVAEIASMGRLRHRNLVQLLGYCRRKGELLLVYDYMPNGSLDKLIHGNANVTLNWNQRFKIIRGVASGLLYLHEGWEQIVVHRDIKASNILLDAEFNGRLGDFGLARLYDHGSDPQTTHVVGTLGYLAPEHTRTGRATRSTDVFAFGAFLLEVVCGQRPIDLRSSTEEVVLVDKVFAYWKRGEILRVVDGRLRGEYAVEVVEMVLKLGIMCSNVEAEERPTMRETVAYLDGVAVMPDLRGLELSSGGVFFPGERRREDVIAGWAVATAAGRDGFSGYAMSNTMPTMPFDTLAFTRSGSVTESHLSEGR